ncbi:MAG: DUF305 domain-containing protein [Actinomycetota bacterium]|nr:DUF305 domain-containing protein [Actinomycetota bacterium]
MKRPMLVLSSLALVAAVACGSGEGPASEQGAAAPEGAHGAGAEGEAHHNEADVAFLQGMIPHHQQAVEMSELALSNTENPEVRDLAERIEAAQQPEIDQMNDLLQSWGVEAGAASGGEHGAHGGGGGGHPGMLSEDQLGQLAAARGAEFDRLFLTGMIEHHRGAVTASEKELAEGASEDAKALAQEIIDAQEAEIAEMEQLLA